MSVRLITDDTIALQGTCPIDDAETLLEYLLDRPARRVDWAQCEAAHTAVIQILMISKAVLLNAPKNLFLAAHVFPVLSRLAD